MTSFGVAAASRSGHRRRRDVRLRNFVMTPPTYFAVEYSINPWMDIEAPVDPALALAQWERLRRTYQELGHVVDLVEPVPGLPDMVYAANGGLVVGGTAVVAKFAYPQRAGETAAYGAWMVRHGYEPVQTRHTNEGQGDLLVAGSILLAGYGFRTDRRAHGEIAQLVGRPTYSFELVDPRFYHLDTALAVLDDTTVAYYPPAFSNASRVSLRTLFPDAIEVASTDAYVFGLNVVSDGCNVVLPAAATGFAAQLRDAGFNPIGVDLSELFKGGGSIKCCTLEVHS
ncbi:N-dimethylarginine dimethylaminohydrolase [Mycolicibacterium novocastrense]|uniref:Amidinotransferase n=1 Tax=Mycolicibacterium novocastrense TaxID=59813 RepID=A0AAW5SVN7_MYCNV|nr:dimethylargininase [Mycolicibacterium novocastrense]KUH67957.1 N-dimethylarginine dimethylaminohydrolase [Mycolicibacterium novocastrense]KUH68429.1 N-dimethylarginine dimethylaminohydrolase [Mycolicibacterium novocastrense]KUH73510.1 N-dimethylarginine dimethylaminohydrolase [Mycolicibacterium novocastrense]MCV7027127.1 N-dimethylarginine dimethylaminohydrolase [Mycolicibacterium novocastrense]GAT07751.1 amidinotransferase [Mycolicibacterium novocastrense]